MRRRTFLRAAAAIPVALLSGCAVYDDGYYVGDVGYAPVPNPHPHPVPPPPPPASPSGTATSAKTRTAASETGSAAAFRWARSETGVPTGTSAPWASPPRGSADDASDRRSAPDRTWKTGTGFTESSRTPRRSRNGSPPGAWSSSGSRTSRPAPRPAPNGPHGPGEPPPGFPR